MKYDYDKMKKLIVELVTARGRLAELAGLQEHEFINNPHMVASAKYHFIVAIESIIDICNHLIAKNKLRVPEDYGDTFKILGEAGFFSVEFMDTLTAMAKFRNRLVHVYWDVDSAQLYSILLTDLKDLDHFIELIKQELILK
ncbi:type VII toxin-antitoxin system HepT family RNase toxin [Zhaonella formicivorans]|uniref:type VII toxin-antitoxin system HepT family RNase toxin n=1 Tax=Zhaonella formicivorans TaxID=2528593 RepID=UPI001D10D45F|nr:DUF86 domain-containing protein [Zhaonella formicivorans]